MKFRSLQENLRKEIWKRIEAGELTGLKLARQAGFQQAHISNFLNGKRGLSLEGMDRVLSAQRLSVLDLLDPAEINKRATIPPPSEEGYENVLLVEPRIAASQPLIITANVKDILKFKKAFLKKLRPELETPREGWHRFLLVRMDAHEGMGMYPRMLPGAIVLLDRHYNSLKPYHKGDHNIYGVNKNGGLSVRYLELSGPNLVLRPHNPGYPVEVVPIAPDKSYSDYIVGRVCHVGIET